jgi:DNA-binding XRE family transcriptional regulator
MIDRLQVKAARALLEWSQSYLAEIVGLGREVIAQIESGRSSPRKSLVKIQEELEKHGIEFLDNSGVRKKSQIVKFFDGEEGQIALFDDIFETLNRVNEPVFIYGVHSSSPLNDQKFREFISGQMEKLDNAGIPRKILKKSGDKTFLGSIENYRWVSSEGAIPVPLYVYGNNVAFSNLVKPQRTIIIESELIAQTVKHLFSFAWDHAAEAEL